MIDPGSIVLVRFPFADTTSAKQRPALVLAHLHEGKPLELVIVAMITSKVDSPKIAGDFEIENWKEAGLLHPSKLRLGKIVTVDRKLIRKELGQLSKSDHSNAKHIFQSLFHAWV